MTEPERLARTEGLGAALLTSAKDERAPAGASRRVLGSAAVAAAIASNASSSAAAAAPWLARWAVWKWLALGVVGAGALTTASVLSTPVAGNPPATMVARQSAPQSGRRELSPQSLTPLASSAGTETAPEPSPSPVAAAEEPATPSRPRAARPAPGATRPQPTSSPKLATETAVPVAAVTAAPLPEYAPSHLAQEIASLDEAKKALAGGSPAAALAVLDAYDAAHPAGTLRAEATALRIEALAASGRHGEARAALAAFQAAHPGSPLLDSLARAVGD